MQTYTQIYNIKHQDDYTFTNSFPPVVKIKNVARFLVMDFENRPQGFNSPFAFVWFSLRCKLKIIKYLKYNFLMSIKRTGLKFIKSQRNYTMF